MELSALKIDSAKINAGEWISDIPGFGDIRLKVRGFDNPDFRRRQSELVGALPKARRNDPAATDALMRQLIVETILQDWSGITVNGKALSYSPEKAAEIVGDPDNKLFLDGVSWAASQVGVIRDENLKDDAGN